MKKLLISTVAMVMITSCQPKDQINEYVSGETVFEKIMVKLKSGDGFEIVDGEMAKFYPNIDADADSGLRLLNYTYLGRIKVTDVAKKDIAFQYIGHQITDAYGVKLTRFSNGPASASFQPNYIILMAGRVGVVNLIFTATEEEGQYDMLMTVAANKV